ncbi:MAG: hypothetical protein ABI175_08695, partial [Polyangiales bacterium]
MNEVAARPIRVLMLANDGLGAGHVVRMLAIARRMRARAKVSILLATTSEADALIREEKIACVRGPPPLTARANDWSDAERRQVSESVLRGAFEGFRPDLLVTDTFPSGPHGELAGLVTTVSRRALVRRSVRLERAGDSILQTGLRDYHLAITPEDPIATSGEVLPIASVRVPPITLLEASEALGREDARRQLGLPMEGRFILVCAGGGGDGEARIEARRAALAIDRLAG